MFFLPLALFMGAMSLFAFLAFRSDKRRAERNQWRVTEASLLMLAFLGGWPGAKLAQRLYRHKTRKEPFRSNLNVMVAGPLFMMAFVGFAQAHPQTNAALRDLGEQLWATTQTLAEDLMSGHAGQPAADSGAVVLRRGSDTSSGIGN